MPETDWETYLRWELSTAAHSRAKARATHTARLRRTWDARPDKAEYVEAIRNIESWHSSVELWQDRIAADQRRKTLDLITKHARTLYRSLSMELFFLRRLDRYQETKDAKRKFYTENRSRRHTSARIDETTTAIHALQPSVPAIDIANRLFPSLPTFAPRLRAHIIESCSHLHEEPDPDDLTAEEELLRNLKFTMRTWRETSGSAFANEPLAQDIARRSRRMGYFREKSFPDRGIQRTWRKVMTTGKERAVVPLTGTERRALFDKPLTPPPMKDPTGIVWLYRWWRGRR